LSSAILSIGNILRINSSDLICFFCAGFMGFRCLIIKLHVQILRVTEEEIIRGLQSGDEKVFREVVDRYQTQVFRTCMGMLHHREDAEDIAQEVFVEVYRSVKNFRTDSKLSTWIYRIAINKSLNHLRKRSRSRWLQPFEMLFNGKSEETVYGSGESMPHAALEKKQRMQKLHAAIDALPERQKTVFLLNKFEELSYQEIAEVTGQTISSVESLLHRAKVNLQKKLWNCYKKECL